MNNKRAKWYVKVVRICTVSMLPVCASAEPPESISLVAPAFWCPYSCNSGDKQEGFSVDIIKAALAVSGIKVNYRNMTYDRALVEVREGRVDAAAPILKEEAPDFVYPGEPVSATEYCFYTLSDHKWQFKGIDSLRGIRFSATSGYTYGAELDAYITAEEKKGAFLLKGDNVPDRMIKMLQGERFDAFLDDTRLIEYMKKEKYQSTALRNAGCLENVHFGYLGLSPIKSTSPEIAKLFDEGMKALGENGQLQAILKSYGVESWR
ncbi:MAG: ABC transporter substrate-binding protein [Pseudomonadales bacterium]|nr:ABC transporter substrate-binding protein [Pseudomonadales bacterium]